MACLSINHYIPRNDGSLTRMETESTLAAFCRSHDKLF